MDDVSQPNERLGSIPRSSEVPPDADRVGPMTVTDRAEDAPARTMMVSIVATARPRQWVKNLLVFGAPATGGVLLEGGALVSTTLAFVAFSMVASGVYYINDVVDAPEDRHHPVKRHRPIASGLIAPRLAVGLGATFISAGIAVAFAAAGWRLVGVAAGYVALVLAYTFRLRSIALLDLAAIAGGFLLRAVAGGVAADVALSNWFLTVASFGSLFLAAGKRHAEFVRLGTGSGSHRTSLDEYTERFLRYIQYSASTIAIAAYTQWTFEGEAGGTIWSGLSIIPFVLAIFRYGLLLEKGKGAAPEETVLSDPPLIALGCVWVLLVALGVYLD